MADGEQGFLFTKQEMLKNVKNWYFYRSPNLTEYV